MTFAKPASKRVLPENFINGVISQKGHLFLAVPDEIAHHVSYSNTNDEYITLRCAFNAHGTLEVSLKTCEGEPHTISIAPDTNFTALNKEIVDYFESVGHESVSEAINLAQAIVNSSHLAYTDEQA